MPKPNYAYEKRQRELAKKAKKDVKAKEKAGRKTPLSPDDGSEPELQDDGVEGQDAAAGGADGAGAGAGDGGGGGGGAD